MFCGNVILFWIFKSMINVYIGWCWLFIVYFVCKFVGKMDWFWFCWSVMIFYMDREYLVGKGC